MARFIVGAGVVLDGVRELVSARVGADSMTDFIKVAELNDLEDGELMAVEVDGEPVCLAKVDGTVYAFTDDCTHIGGPLNEGELDGEVLTCPWHGAQFDVRTGKVLRGPARQDIQTYPVRMDGASILVSLPDE
jgi:3-phenylpropionate/trans-cinnamate dioxygenase ferredoxin component